MMYGGVAMLEIANMNSSFFTGDINAVSAPKRNVCIHQYRHTHTLKWKRRRRASEMYYVLFQNLFCLQEH